MDRGKTQSGKSAPAPVNPAEPVGASRPQWRNVWQLPALGLSVVLMFAALASYFLAAPRPDFEALLAQADTLLESERFTEALELADRKVRPYVGAPGSGLTPEHVQRFHIVRGRAIRGFQQARRVDREENHDAIVLEYLKAEKAGAHLAPRDVFAMAESYIALDKLDAALERVETLGDDARPQRTVLLRRMIDIRLAAAAPDASGTLQLLEMLLRDAEIGVSDRAWALTRQVDLLLRQGYPDQALNKLVMSMPRFLVPGAGPEPDVLGELYLLLARAYKDTGALDDASAQLERAVELLPEADGRRGNAILTLAQIDAAKGRRDEARVRFAAVVDAYPDEPIRLPALLGLAEAEAGVGDADAAIDRYSQLVDDLSLGRKHPGVSRDAVAHSLMGRYTDRSAAADTAGALRFARLAERLYAPSAVPKDVLLALARAHRQEADGLLSAAGTGPGRVVALARLEPATREKARSHLVAAADCFKRHATAVVDTDNEAFGNSLWLAADSFDRAGDAAEAIPLLQEFADGFRADPRRDEARFRLAQAHQARGAYDTAAAGYRELIDEDREGRGGPFADASYVPLARALLADADESNDAEARGLLGTVVEGRVGGSNTPDYRDALVLLAQIEYQAGAYAAAIGHLEEALARFADDAHSAAMLFDLADAHRRDAAAITGSLVEEMPEAERARLEETRGARLRRAMELFELVRRSLAAHEPDYLSDADRLRLRNSHFYLGDCAFDLREFDTAIRLYDAARERYPRDPASLVALIQIVNAYVEQGDLKRAATANERARRFYESLPEEVWSDTTLPIGKRDWQRWLDSLAVLTPGAAANAGEGPPGGR